MSKTQHLVITCPGDVHALVVAKHLQNRNHDLLFLTSEDGFYSDPQFSVLRLIDEEVGGDSIFDCESVWWRKPTIHFLFKRFETSAECEDNQFKLKEVQTFFDFVNNKYAEDGKFILGDEHSRGIAKNKLHQLSIAKKLGLRIPKSIISNSKNNLLDFYYSVDEKCITKSISSASPSSRGEPVALFTSAVTEVDLMGLQEINSYPILLQEKIEKEFELRITVVGNKLFTAKIDSQHVLDGELDWRLSDSSTRGHSLFELPAHIQENCLELCRALQLNFGTIDLAVTPENEYVFFEINPNGQYLWIEEMLQLPISEAIAELLINPDENRLV